MLFDQYPNTVPPEYVEAARAHITKEFNESILTGSEVCALCGISQPQLSRIVVKENPFFAFKKGNTLLFITHYAMPWIEEIKARKADAKPVKKSKSRKPGRPKAGEGPTSQDWRDTNLNGWNIIIGEEFATPEEWYRDLSVKMSIHFKEALGTPEHQQWLEMRKALRSHFNIPEGSI